MRASHTLRWLAPLLLGTALGVFLADANYWHPRNGVVLWILKVPTLYGILYYPSGLLFYCCRFLYKGPSGSAAWAIYPWCVVAFWATFGLLIGLWLLRRRALATYAATHPYTGLDAASLVTQVAQVRQDYVAAHRFVFLPLARQHRPDLGLFCAYLVSGAIHAWLTWVALGAFAAFGMAAFFGLQAVFILAEDRLQVRAWPVPLARAWTLTILLATSPLIIGPYLRMVHL